MGSLQISFSFQVEIPSDFICHVLCGVCFGVCFMLSGSYLAAVFICGDLTTGGCNTAALEFIIGRHTCLMVMVCGPCKEHTEWLLLPLP